MMKPTAPNLLTAMLLLIAVALAWPLITTKWPAMQRAIAPVTAMLPGSAPNTTVTGRTIGGAMRVVDGDTIDAGGGRYRLAGFDTPERGDLAKCDSERELAARATARLQGLISSGNASLVRVACACREGTEGTRRCNHGRLCGALMVNGRDVGDILVGEGLAHRYVCTGTHCPPRAGWC